VTSPPMADGREKRETGHPVEMLTRLMDESY